MSFSALRELEVWRCLSSGERVRAGTLVQNRQGIYFQYDSGYLADYASLSPFGLEFDNRLHKAPRLPHGGLHGVFADSLPDGWGLFLMDRFLRQQGVDLSRVTPLDRLAWMGGRGTGALQYQPLSDYASSGGAGVFEVAALAEQAQALFEGRTSEVLATLAESGSPGGARPKAHLYFSRDDDQRASSQPLPGYSPWMVKFTASSLLLGHEEGCCEAVYLALAAKAGITVPGWRLLGANGASSAPGWLALQRFDCSEAGRFHMHSLCGLLDADFRAPSMDYEDLIKASQILCRSPAAGQEQFRRAIFNLFSLNQDDHTKNWAFIQGDDGRWRLAPFFDVTFSPSLRNEHATSFMGYGNSPPLKAIQKLAGHAGFGHWREARLCIEQVVDSLAQWSDVAAGLGVGKETVAMIAGRLDEVRKLNSGLLGQ